MALESVYWGLPIVAYPYISGLVAGSFIVGTLSKVFGQKKFEPVAKLAMLVSFAFLAVAPLAPGADLRQPVNGYELYTRAHLPYAPIGLFTTIWTLYMVLLVFEGFFLFRGDLIRFRARLRLSPVRDFIYRVFTLGRREIPPYLEERDHRVGAVLAAIGILLAFAFHGYVGFIFGALKARPLWSTPLMPVLFITSAIVSGVALMNLVYILMSRYFTSERRVDGELVAGLNSYLLAFILLDLFFDFIEILTGAVRAYAAGGVFAGWSTIFLGGPLTFSYWGIQLTLGLVIPLLLLLFRSVRRSSAWSSLISILVLVGVFAMRYNTVIGGQLQPKVGQGLLVASIPLLGRDSVQVVIGIVAIALLILEGLTWLFPWHETWVPVASVRSQKELNVSKGGVNINL